MGIPVLVLGESGSGKTYSIKNMDPSKIGIFLVEKTRLPFKKEFKCAKNANYQKIIANYHKLYVKSKKNNFRKIYVNFR